MGLGPKIDETDNLVFATSAAEMELEFPNCNTKFLAIQRGISKLNDNISFLSKVAEQSHAKLSSFDERFHKLIDNKASNVPLGVLADLDTSQSVISDAEQLLEQLRDSYEKVTDSLPHPSDKVREFEFVPSETVNFNDLSVSEILTQFEISDKQSHNRLTNYFGKIW